MLDESGFRELVDFLLRRVVARADDLDRRSTSQDVLAVAEQLGAGMKAELAVQENPERLDGLVAELTRAKGRADELKQRSAALADHAQRRGGRPAVGHRVRPAGPAALDRPGGRAADRRRRPGRDLGTVRRVVPPAGVLGGVGELRLGRRAGPLAGRPGGRALRRGRRGGAARPALRRPGHGGQGQPAGAAGGGEGRHRLEALHRLPRRLRRHADGRHGHHGGRARAAQPALARAPRCCSAARPCGTRRSACCSAGRPTPSRRCASTSTR